jgi:Flp pilus assembly protein TadB
VLLICVAASFAAVWSAGPGSVGHLARRRLTGTGTAPHSSRPGSSSRPSPVENTWLRSVLCVVACIACGWMLGGRVLGIAGVPAGMALSWWIGGLESPAAIRAKAEIGRDLPLAADLLAACARAGRPVDESLRIVASAVGGTLAARLDPIVARLALGADPQAQWRLVAADPQLATLGRAMARTLESGAPLADALTRLAEDARRERRTQTQLLARSVGVKAAGPLALCFLPAFMVIGVIPTIAGAFSNLVL